MNNQYVLSVWFLYLDNLDAMLRYLPLNSEGMVDPGEDAAAAAVREVKEETGIDAEVVALIAFREAHMPKNSTWMSGNTNIFMTFLLKPKTQAIAVQEREIAKCEWCVSCRMHGCGKQPCRPRVFLVSCGHNRRVQ